MSVYETAINEPQLKFPNWPTVTQVDSLEALNFNWS